jgi:hypothetical protein
VRQRRCVHAKIAAVIDRPHVEDSSSDTQHEGCGSNMKTLRVAGRASSSEEVQFPTFAPTSKMTGAGVVMKFKAPSISCQIAAYPPPRFDCKAAPVISSRGGSRRRPGDANKRVAHGSACLFSVWLDI